MLKRLEFLVLEHKQVSKLLSSFVVSLVIVCLIAVISLLTKHYPSTVSGSTPTFASTTAEVPSGNILTGSEARPTQDEGVVGNVRYYFCVLSVG